MLRAIHSVLMSATITLGLAGAAQASPLQLEDYFAGQTKATGSFTAINGLKRTFTVDLHGRFDGKVLTLVEDFHFADGERDRKTWRFVKTSPTTYRGTREDVVGETKVRIDGKVATFTYLVDLPGKSKPMRVRFHDRMELMDGGRLENTALVTKWGFPVALTRVSFTRPK